MSLGSFLELLGFYLSSTLVIWGEKVYTQRSGVCIGSRVTPVLSNIFLSSLDTVLMKQLEGLVIKAFRYVDDYLLIVQTSSFQQHASKVLKVSEENSQGLTFTSEVPHEGVIQFLDLKLTFQEKQVCWMYNPRSNKPLLNYSSCHSKVVKTGIAVNSLNSSLTKSCVHTMGTSFAHPTEKLKNAGFSDRTLVFAAKKVLTKLRHLPGSTTEKESRKQCAVIPNLHAISHRIKKIAGKFDVDVVFSANNKL